MISKKLRKLFSILLVLSLVFSNVPMAFADEVPEQSGDNEIIEKSDCEAEEPSEVGEPNGENDPSEEVETPENLPTLITLSVTGANLKVGENLQLEVSFLPDGVVGLVNFISSDESVATVDDNGTVTAIAKGQAVITAQCGELTASCDVTVEAEERLEGISFSEDSLDITKGSTANLKDLVAVSPNDYSCIITWESDDESVVTVDENGTVTAVKMGVANVTAKAEGFSATITVNVTSDLTKISLNKTSLKMVLGQPGSQLTAECTPEDADDELIWESSNENVVTVDETGYVKAINVGKASVTVSSKSGISVTCEVEVAPDKPTISSATTNLKAGVIRWNDVEGAEKYYVYRSTSKNGTYTKVATKETLQFTDNELKAGKTYYYKVKAKGGNVTGEFSDVKSLTLMTAPTIVSTKSNTVKWNSVSGAEKYYVYRSTSENGTYKKVATKETLQFTDSGLKVGKIYYYKVQAKGNGSLSDYSAVKSLTGTLKAPTIVKTASSTASTITISWNKSTGASGYYVYKQNGSSWKKIATTKSTTYTDKTSSGVEKYAIVAYMSGKSSANSDKSAVITSRTLKASSKIGTSSSSETASGSSYICCNVDYNKVSGATKYQVAQRYGTSGSWKTLKTTTSTTILAEQKHGATKYYYYRVRAVYVNGGVTTYGPWKTMSTGNSWYWEPRYSVIMSSKAKSNQSLVLLYVKNTGKADMTILSSGAVLEDRDYSSFNRSLYLCETSSFSEISSITIKPGESKYVWFAVRGKSTWYDSKTKVYYKFKYDGETYLGRSSYYYGNSFVKYSK